MLPNQYLSQGTASAVPPAGPFNDGALAPGVGAWSAKKHPSVAKASAKMAARSGTTEVVPFQNINDHLCGGLHQRKVSNRIEPLSV
jgi:hypothetical protein